MSDNEVSDTSSLGDIQPVSKPLSKLTKKEEEAVLMCSIENKEACMMCTS